MIKQRKFINQCSIEVFPPYVLDKNNNIYVELFLVEIFKVMSGVIVVVTDLMNEIVIKASEWSADAVEKEGA
jgi:hypothetical protein